MRPQIEIYTPLFGATYWLEFNTAEEQRATMTFLDSATTIGNLRPVGDGTPYYFVETREQKDALDHFLRELRRSDSPRTQDGRS